MKRLTVSLPDNYYHRLEGLAIRSHLSKSWVVRLAVEELMEKYGEGQQIALPLERNAAGQRD